jgi:hypothetical protein
MSSAGSIIFRPARQRSLANRKILPILERAEASLAEELRARRKQCSEGHRHEHVPGRTVGPNPRRRLDREADRLEAADELANVLPHLLGPGGLDADQRAGLRSNAGRGDRPLPFCGAASIPSVTTGETALTGFDREVW